MIDINSLLQENKTVVYLNFGTVKYNVGTLLYANRAVFFEFSQDFLNHYLSISPIHLKPIAGIQQFSNPDHFNLPGVFYDALPDGWGLLLQDRYLRKMGISIAEISPIHRLLLRENRSVGALEFIPEYKFNESESFKPIDVLFSESEKVLCGKSSDVIPLLLQLNGSSAGARPKAMMKYDSQKNEWYYGKSTNDAEVEDWLVKFPTKQDGLDAGAIEFVYAEMAKISGLIIPETQLIESGHHQGYFAVKRFDHIKNRRFHTHSISGLLHHNFRIPSLDYEQIFQVVWSLTQSISELEQLFLQLVFNVVFHNRDDHGKNFSLLMDEKGAWKLSPSYDLTFSFGPNGEHCTTIMGEGKSPKKEHLLKTSSLYNFSKNKTKELIERVIETSEQWENLAKNAGINSNRISEIKKRFVRL